ncbi:oral-facial-digital syndrome 1 protein [Pelomyxa schiedti]|nr:oral-facial-digital syndrome 1 protein [Pelomyxa schiedti]
MSATNATDSEAQRQDECKGALNKLARVLLPTARGEVPVHAKLVHMMVQFVESAGYDMPSDAPAGFLVGVKKALPFVVESVVCNFWDMAVEVYCDLEVYGAELDGILMAQAWLENVVAADVLELFVEMVPAVYKPSLTMGVARPNGYLFHRVVSCTKGSRIFDYWMQKNRDEGETHWPIQQQGGYEYPITTHPLHFAVRNGDAHKTAALLDARCLCAESFEKIGTFCRSEELLKLILNHGAIAEYQWAVLKGVCMQDKSQLPPGFLQFLSSSALPRETLGSSGCCWSGGGDDILSYGDDDRGAARPAPPRASAAVVGAQAKNRVGTPAPSPTHSVNLNLGGGRGDGGGPAPQSNSGSNSFVASYGSGATPVPSSGKAPAASRQQTPSATATFTRKTGGNAGGLGSKSSAGSSSCGSSSLLGGGNAAARGGIVGQQTAEPASSLAVAVDVDGGDPISDGGYENDDDGNDDASNCNCRGVDGGGGTGGSVNSGNWCNSMNSASGLMDASGSGVCICNEETEVSHRGSGSPRPPAKSQGDSYEYSHSGSVSRSVNNPPNNEASRSVANPNSSLPMGPTKGTEQQRKSTPKSTPQLQANNQNQQPLKALANNSLPATSQPIPAQPQVLSQSLRQQSNPDPAPQPRRTTIQNQGDAHKPLPQSNTPGSAIQPQTLSFRAQYQPSSLSSEQRPQQSIPSNLLSGSVHRTNPSSRKDAMKAPTSDGFVNSHLPNYQLRPADTNGPKPVAPKSAGNPKGPVRESVTEEQLKQLMFSQFKQSGIEGNLRAHLRLQLIGMFNNNLQSSNKPKGLTLQQKVINGLIASHLKGHDYNYTLSVFMSEVGTNGIENFDSTSSDDKQTTLNAITDALAIFHVPSNSSLHSRVTSTFSGYPTPQLYTCTTNDPMQETGLHGSSVNSSTESVLHKLLLSLCQTSSCVEKTTQTEQSTIDEKLRQIDEELHRSDNPTNLIQTLEQRMAEFQKQCNDRAASDLAAQIREFKRIESANIRAEEEAKWSAKLNELQATLDSQYLERVAKVTDADSQRVNAMKKREQELERTYYEQRQQLLSEIESLRRQDSEMRREQEALLRKLRSQESSLHDKELALETKAREMEKKLDTSRKAMSEEFQQHRENFEKKFQDERETFARDRARLERETLRLMTATSLPTDKHLQSGAPVADELIEYKQRLAAAQRTIEQLTKKLHKQVEETQAHLTEKGEPLPTEQGNETSMREKISSLEMMLAEHHKQIQIMTTQKQVLEELQEQELQELREENAYAMKQHADQCAIKVQELEILLDSTQQQAAHFKNQVVYLQQENDELRLALRQSHVTPFPSVPSYPVSPKYPNIGIEGTTGAPSSPMNASVLGVSSLYPKLILQPEMTASDYSFMDKMKSQSRQSTRNNENITPIKPMPPTRSVDFTQEEDSSSESSGTFPEGSLTHIVPKSNFSAPSVSLRNASNTQNQAISQATAQNSTPAPPLNINNQTNTSTQKTTNPSNNNDTKLPVAVQQQPIQAPSDPPKKKASWLSEPSADDDDGNDDTRMDNAEEQHKAEISISEKPEVINPSANGEEEEDKPADATEEEEPHKPTLQEPEVQPQSPDTSELMGALSQNFDDF